jgi:hypothetical protein
VLQTWAPSKASSPLRNGSIVVDYLVLLKLPFSLQLESEYEKVKMSLKEELQNASQGGNSCQSGQSDQSEWSLEGGDRVRATSLTYSSSFCVALWG